MKPLAAILLLCLASGAHAQSMQRESAFVEHHLTLQLSDRTPDKEALVLSVAANILKAYGPDKVAIDVVGFGPGLDLMRADNPDAVKLDSLVAQGVRFDACQNTIDTIERETGKTVVLNPHAQRVPSGVQRIIELAEHGYVTVRP